MKQRALTLRAYTVHQGDSMEVAVLVFAHNAKEARQFGYNWLEYAEYIETVADRNEADEPSGEPRVVYDAKTLWRFRFHDGNDFTSCDTCGRYQWEDVPESIRCEFCYQCQDCGCMCDEEASEKDEETG